MKTSREDADPFPMKLSAVLLLAITVGAGCQAAPAPTTQPKVILAAVGDILFARGVAQVMGKHGADYPFSGTKSIISKADIAICNLECPLSTRGYPRKTRFLFRADPSYAKTLSRNGFDVACLANNHTQDYGRDAMLDTKRFLEGAGITAVGAGINRDEAVGVRVIIKNGLRVGFLSYKDVRDMGVVALADLPSVAGVDMGNLKAEVKRAKSVCDVLVVSFHWGSEYMRYPSERQQMIAHICIDNGADLVLGHHPHVLQTKETYRGKPIVYSLGAFVWDGILPDTRKSEICLFKLGKSSAKIAKVVKVRIKNCRPEVLKTHR